MVRSIRFLIFEIKRVYVYNSAIYKLTEPLKPRATFVVISHMNTGMVLASVKLKIFVWQKPCLNLVGVKCINNKI